MKKTKQKTKTELFLENTSYDDVYQYFIVENHSKLQCYDYFHVTERIFRAFLEHYKLKKPQKLVYDLSCKTRMLKYDNPNYNNREQAKKTCMEKFGSESPLANKKIWQKTYNETIEKYGGTGFAAMPKDKRVKIAKKANATMWNNYNSNNEFKERYWAAQNRTKRNNNSFNTSKREEQLYEELVNKFGIDNVLTQYYDSRYPYSCDFYIKSLDLFIELNAHWTHGTHPFDNTNINDLYVLKKWEEKAKTSKFYLNAINTWTVRDVEKLKKLKENKLNFIIIYNTMEVSNINDYKY